MCTVPLVVSNVRAVAARLRERLREVLAARRDVAVVGAAHSVAALVVVLVPGDHEVDRPY